jgi:hypothetical protein
MYASIKLVRKEDRTDIDLVVVAVVGTGGALCAGTGEERRTVRRLRVGHGKRTSEGDCTEDEGCERDHVCLRYDVKELAE